MNLYGGEVKPGVIEITKLLGRWVYEYKIIEGMEGDKAPYKFDVYGLMAVGLTPAEPWYRYRVSHNVTEEVVCIEGKTLDEAYERSGISRDLYGFIGKVCMLSPEITEGNNMKKIKLNCVCRPTTGVVRKGSMEICKGQNVLQSAKNWYEEQVVDLVNPVNFEDCFVHIDGGVVSRKAATFIDDIYVGDDSTLYVIPFSVEERKSADIKRDIKLLLSRWFLALEDEGVNPWRDEECVAMANKYQYTTQDYQDFLRTLS